MSEEHRAPTPARLVELVDAMADQPVAMLVDLVADRFITGTPKRISREAPVLILRHEQETVVPGGGANAVANVAALGGRPIVLGVVGEDAMGEALVGALAERGVTTDSILRRAGYRTPTKTRVLGGARHAIKQQIVRFDIEDRLTLRQDERDRLLATLEDAAPVRAAVLSDYGYGAVDPALVPALRERVGASCPLLGDSRYRLEALAGLDGATPNLEEVESLQSRLGMTESDSTAPLGPGLRERLGLQFLTVTQGSDGLTLFAADGTVHLPVHGTDQVADVTGAGDTVIGTFALALAAGATPIEAACLANYAGGVVVMKMGTATLTPEELRLAVTADREPLRGMTWARS